MMRLLLLCLLLLPTATAYSNADIEGSGEYPDDDDEELYPATSRNGLASHPDKATGEDSESDEITMIIIVVAVVAVALIAAIIAIILVRRHRNKQQQGIYSVPIDQDKKEAV